jgi:hypothetical protein
VTEQNEAWMDELFPERKKQRAEMEEKGLIFAQKYLVFGGPTSDPRARELLEHWTLIARHTRIPVGATAQEYAAHNAFRELVEGIWAQIEFASKGGNQPKLRTKE